LLVCLSAVGSEAHFRLGTSLRIVHVERLATGLRIYIRMPTPLVYAKLLTGSEASDNDALIPFVRSGEEDGVLVHRIDVKALVRDPRGFGQLVAGGFRLSVDGEPVAPEVEAVAVHPREAQPPFAELSDVRAALASPPYPPDRAPVFVGDTVTDLRLFLPRAPPNAEIRLATDAPAAAAAQGLIANIFLDHLPSGTQITREPGLLREAVVLNTSASTAALTFTQQGIRHILDGWDHLLFVLCLVLGATTLGAMIWRVTGFTLGHMITLIGGFFGFVPAGDWFIPSVEMAIALSIVYAGAVALLRRGGEPMLALTVGIGLLHGFGFAAALSDLLDLEAPRLWVSLLSFNLGIELGQLAIVLAVWPALWLLRQYSPLAWRRAMVMTCLAAMAVALYWSGERLIVLTAMLAP
jgi:hypothetical protein